jgi:hypothetical protein
MTHERYTEIRQLLHDARLADSRSVAELLADYFAVGPHESRAISDLGEEYALYLDELERRDNDEQAAHGTYYNDDSGVTY